MIEQLGLENGVAVPFALTIERMVEGKAGRGGGDSTQPEIRLERVALSVPLLALVHPPSLHLQEMNVEFGVEVVETREEPIASSMVPAGAKATSLSKSRAVFAPLGAANHTTMKVNMKIVREVPEGLARLGDLLADAMVGGKAPAGEPPKAGGESSAPVGRIPGIGREVLGALRREGIETVDDLVSAAASDEGVRKLAKGLKVSAEKVREWVELGKSIEE